MSDSNSEDELKGESFVEHMTQVFENLPLSSDLTLTTQEFGKDIWKEVLDTVSKFEVTLGAKNNDSTSVSCHQIVVQLLEKHISKQKNTVKHLLSEYEWASDAWEEHYYVGHEYPRKRAMRAIYAANDALWETPGISKFYELWRKTTSQLLEIAGHLSTSCMVDQYDGGPVFDYLASRDEDKCDEGVDLEWDIPMGRQNFQDAARD